jgi:hypothetical protein
LKTIYHLIAEIKQVRRPWEWVIEF